MSTLPADTADTAGTAVTHTARTGTTATATADARADAATATLLEGRSLTRSYGRSPALRGVSIDLVRGEIAAVTGPSGSGKSTLLLCLAGILAPDSGEVLFHGRRIDRETEVARSVLRRRQFGVLLQSGQLIPELTATENVALPLLLDGVRRGAAAAVAQQWLDRLGVGELVAKRPTEMSGGQAQRVAVARAMVTGPEVLFADEPTGALDTLAGESVMNLLVRVAAEQGTTVLIVTHDARVAAYAVREIGLRDGLVEDVR